MSIELWNYQWELGGLVFGYGQPVDHETNVSPPDYTPRVNDQANPLSDGMSPGVDLFEPGTWQFQLFTNGESEADALAALQDFKQVWRGDAYRKLPGRVAELRYRLNDRTRVVYGRPRRCSAPLGVEYLSGKILITADFQTVSELFFEDFENTLTVTHKEPAGGGWTTPFRFPLRSIGAQGAGLPNTFAVGGVNPTPILVDFIGPLDASGLAIDGKPFIDLAQSIPSGVTVTVDARPWVTAVYRSDGAGVAGLLSPRSRMPKMLLEPGVHQATLLGSSPTGTGRAVIRWRSAYPSV